MRVLCDHPKSSVFGALCDDCRKARRKANRAKQKATFQPTLKIAWKGRDRDRIVLAATRALLTGEQWVRQLVEENLPREQPCQEEA